MSVCLVCSGGDGDGEENMSICVRIYFVIVVGKLHHRRVCGTVVIIIQLGVVKVETLHRCEAMPNSKHMHIKPLPTVATSQSWTHSVAASASVGRA